VGKTGGINVKRKGKENSPVQLMEKNPKKNSKGEEIADKKKDGAAFKAAK